MTDLEKTIELYKGFGIKLKVLKEDIYDTIALKSDETEHYHKAGNLHKKFDGYSGCESIMTFTKEGKFVKQGFWES